MYQLGCSLQWKAQLKLLVKRKILISYNKRFKKVGFLHWLSQKLKAVIKDDLLLLFLFCFFLLFLYFPVQNAVASGWFLLGLKMVACSNLGRMLPCPHLVGDRGTKGAKATLSV